MSKLHLIPIPLAENSLHTIPIYLHEIIKTISVWFVEDVRTARRFLKSIDRLIDIDALQFLEVNQQTSPNINEVKQLFDKHLLFGLMSEAGCPAVADPGSLIVEIAHQNNVKVVPHIGPNSIIMALMASGMNGQKFMFHGYLPIKNPERTKAIQHLETESIANNSTQIFIEAPYRNHQLLEDILRSCKGQTKLCVAIDLSSEHETIISKRISDWKKVTVDFHKKPAIFLLQG